LEKSNSRQLSAQALPRPIDPISGHEEKANGRSQCDVGQHKWNPSFGTAGNKEADAALHHLGFAKEPHDVRGPSPSSRKEPPDVRGPSPSSLPVSVRQTGSSIVPFFATPDGKGPPNPSPPLPVGPSAGAGGGLVFSMEKDGHSAGWERSVRPIPPSHT
jgi:hypothetical protein